MDPLKRPVNYSSPRENRFLERGENSLFFCFFAVCFLFVEFVEDFV